MEQIIGKSLEQYFDATTSSIILGMTFGIKSNIDGKLYESIKDAGLSHLIVFSGSNIALLYNMISRGLAMLGKKWKIYIGGAILIGLVSLLPKEASIVRAIIMWVIYKTGELSGKKVSGMYTLMVTTILMLTFDPHLITSVSFQLSISAILGISIFDSGSDPEMPAILKNIYKDIKTTVSAQVFTSVLVYQYFNSLNPLSLIANILVAPIVAPIMIIGIIITICSKLNIEAKIIANIGFVLVRYLIVVVNIFARTRLT